MKQNKIPRNEYIRKPVGKTNPYKDDVDYISKMGYRDDSPFKNRAYIDIHTPSGMIDMSNTGIPLMANGVYLPPYSGMINMGTPNVREVPMAQDGLEQKINRFLGEPMKKAQEAAVNTEKWYNPKTKKWEEEDPIDNLRHALAGKYTAEAITNKFPSWMKYTGIPQVAGIAGANALGIGHELTSPNRSQGYSWWDTIREAGEDIYNNAVGSLGLSEDQLRYLSSKNMLPDGYAKGNMYFKAYGGDPSLPNITGQYEQGGWLDQYQDAGQLRAATTYQTPRQNPVEYEKKVDARVKQIDDKLKTSDKPLVIYDGMLYSNPYADPTRNEFSMMDKTGSYVPSGVTPFDIMLPVQAAAGVKAGKASKALIDLNKSKKLKPKSNFKSEIDWGNWNKEIPENKALMQEYNTIEQQTKANGTWMKYNDGTPFTGTPEQFVQMKHPNTQNFAGGVEQAEQMYKQDLHRGAHQHIDDFANRDRNDYATFLTNNKTNAESYAGSDGLSKTYYHPDINTSGEWIDGIYQLGFPQNLPKVIGEGEGRVWRLLNYDDKIAKGTKSKDYADLFQKELKDNKELYNYVDYNPNKKYLSTDIYANYVKNSANPEKIAEIKNVKDQMGHATNIPTNTVYAIDANKVPIKSLRYNNGMFDISNPNIYKGIIPLGAAGYLGYEGLKETPPKQKNGGWLDEYDEYKRGGQRRKKRGTSKNIATSINDIFMRNYDIFGPAGRNRYDPTAYKTGGWLDNID